MARARHGQALAVARATLAVARATLAVARATLAVARARHGQALGPWLVQP